MSLALGLLVLGMLGCGGAQGPRWVQLARGWRPQPVDELVLALEGWEGLRLVADPAGGEAVWLEIVMPAAEWKPARGGPIPAGFQRWRHERPLTAGLRGSSGDRNALYDEETTYSLLKRALKKSEGEGYFLDDDGIVLQRPIDAELPRELVFSTRLERGVAVDGVWRAAAREVACEGLALWTGEETTLVCDVPASSELRFGTLARGVGHPGTTRFRVELDGEPLLEVEQSSAPDTRARFHTVELPPPGRKGAQLRFAVLGDPAVSLVCNPWIVPRDHGTFGARPWDEPRPDLLLFVADTFRADNMELYGGGPDTCPNLNALAEESVVFLQARSAGVWTLPATVTMMTGLLPPQHGAVWKDVTFSADLPTLTEHLRRAGYRTGAVTDSGYVSRAYGLDRGFDWFEETEYADHHLGRTLATADAFLERDDGRPTFLLVHTYRVHSPYRLGAEESEEALDELMARVRRKISGWDGVADPTEHAQAFIAEYLALYRGGATALDEQFGPWVEGLRGCGFLNRGFLAFTSDHGEAFYEHGVKGHSRLPHDEKLRVPLLLHGGDLARRHVDVAASLVDLAPTLVSLLGLEAPAPWAGRSLLQSDGQQPVFAWNQDDDGTYLALLRGERKLLAQAAAGTAPAELADPAVLVEAYEFRADPGEEHNLLEELGWPAELLRELTPLWQELARPAAPARRVDVGSELAEDLRALGYGE